MCKLQHQLNTNTINSDVDFTQDLLHITSCKQ